MKSTRARELIVGVVFFTLLGVLGVITYVASGVRPFTPPNQLYVYFDEGVGGIRRGNVVRIAGMEVGKVDDMRLLDEGILMRLTVIPGVMVHRGYSIKVRAVTSLGGKYVDFDRGDTDTPPLDLPLRGWPEFPTIDELVAMTGPEGPVLQASTEVELFGELAELAEEITPAIEETARNIGDISEKISTRQGTLGRFVHDTSLSDSVRSTTENVSRASEDISEITRKVREGDGTLARLVNDPTLANRGEELFASMGNLTGKLEDGRGPLGRISRDEAFGRDLADAAEHLDAVMDKLSEGDGTVAALFNDPALQEELARTIENLGDVAERFSGGGGPLGVLTTDEQAQADIERAIAHLERISRAVDEERGSVGRLVNDDRLLAEAEQVLILFREGASDATELAPINAFTQGIFRQMRGESAGSGGLTGGSD
jgi:phospholipid/cholesterol/gamma-HCH transport system substrate-binding protein